MAVEVRGDNSLQWKASIDLSSLKDQVSEINKALGQVGNQIKGQSEEIDRFSRNAANAIKTYISVTAISGFVTSIVKVRGEFQQLEVAFETILGNKEKADQLMAQVVDLAAKTPFGLEDAAKGAKQLLAYGFSAEKVKDTLITLGNVASGVGAPLNDIVYLYGTLRTQGRAFQKDIMQFTGRGIPIIAELAKQFGVAESEVSKLVESGKVGFPEIEKAFQSLTSEGGIFNNLMEKQSQTITGLISNFGDAWATMLNDIGKSQEGPIADIIKGSISVVENYQKVLDMLKSMVVTYGAYRAAVIATAVAQTIAANTAKGWTIAQTLHYRALLLSERAMKLLNATMLTNPYVAVTTAVVGLITVLTVFNKQTDLVRSKQQLLNESSEKINDNLAEQKSKIAPLVEALKQSNLTEKERLGIYNKLNAISPKLVEGLNAQSLSYNGLIKNVNAYLDTIREQMKLEANASAIRESITNENKLQKQFEEQKKYVDKLQQLQKTTGFNATTAGNALVGNVNLDLEKKKLSQIEDAQKRQKQVTEQLAQDSASQQKTNDEQKIKQNKEYWETILKEAQSGYDALTELEIKQGKGKVFIERITQAKEQLKIYDLTGKSIRMAQREEDKYNSVLEKRAKALIDIADIERKSNQTGLLQRQKDLDAINEKYDQQLQSVKDVNAEIEKYNKKYPQKEVPLLGDTETARIEAARQTEIANQAYREDAKNYIDMLDEKRLAFEALEEVEKEGSEQKVQFVRRQYKNQIGEAKSYLDALRTQLASLSLETTVRAPSLKDQIIAGDLRSKIREEEKRISEKQKQDSIQLYTELISLTQKYADKRLAIEKKYSDLLAMLNRDKVNMSVKDYNAALKKLSDLRKQEQQDLSDEFLKNSNAFKEFEKGFSEKTPKDLQKLIDKLKSLREEMKGFGLNLKDVDLAIDATIQEKFASVFGYLSNAMGSLGAEINYQITDTLKITGQQITQIFNNLYTLLSSTSSDSAKSNSLIGLIYTFVNSISSIVTTALQNKKDLESGLEPSAEAANAITLAIQAQNTELERQEKILDGMYGEDKINGLLNLQDKLQEKQEETFEAFKKLSIDAIVSQGEYYVDSLFHGRDKAFRSDTTAGKIFGILNDPLGFIPKTVRIKLETVDTSSMDTIEDYVALLDEIKANGGKLNGRTIVEDDVKSLEELISNYDDLIQKQKDLKTQLQQIFTATTAGSIADSIIAGFKAGKRTIEDFADDFEDLMRNAVLNSLKYRFLETPLQNFYEEFAKKSASDNILTGQEISELQATYKDILASALQQYQNLSNITGLDMSGLNAESSLTGAIKGMSEQQADLLAGQFGGLRMTAIEQLRVATAGLEVLQRIETNTYVINEVAAHTSAVKDTLRRFELNGLKVV
jgi:hypothetical protein